MTRHPSADAQRQAENEACDETGNSERIEHLIGMAALEGAADHAVDEALIASAQAFCVATINRLGRKLYLFRVAHALPCKQCGHSIAPDGYFTSAFAQLEDAIRWAYCTTCRRFTWPKGVR